jgi:hypothetical protein
MFSKVVAMPEKGSEGKNSLVGVVIPVRDIYY